MPCKDITELHKMTINENDELINFESIKKTCGKEIGSDDYIRKYIKKELSEILDIPFQPDVDILNRKFQINIQSIIREYLGLPPMYNDVTTTIAGIENDGDTTNIISKIEFNIPVENITPCANGCKTKCHN